MALVTSWPDWSPVGGLETYRFDLVGLLFSAPGPFLVRTVVVTGPFDAGFRPEEGAAWDLCLTLLERGHRGAIIPEPLIEAISPHADRASVVRGLVDKHAVAYNDHILQVLRAQDGVIADLLCANADLERELSAAIFWA